MDWRQGDEYYLTTHDGRYCICKTFDARDVVYTATRVDGPIKVLTLASRRAAIDDMVGRMDIVREMKAACEADSRARG